ncbi:MAG: tRNA pseudouridine(55) synthase TruB [Patescibacteria group bacterium]
MNGILLVDKPKGWTSFDVVAKVRGVLKKGLATKSSLLETSKRKIRVGHTGTLDPLATGLLVLLVGDYTKKTPELTKLDKTYDVTMKLGETSTTGDEEGEKIVTSKQIPSNEEIVKVLQEFIGELQQTPPAFSAIKINGKRAYKLAREGKEVKIEPRKVTIYSVTLTNYNYPFVNFTTEVSSGTYIRSLVHDVGEKLGTGAYMSDLRRIKVGTFDVSQSISMQDVDHNLILSSVQTID